MPRMSRPLAAALAAAALVAAGCGTNAIVTPGQSGGGTLVVQLTDAPFPIDSVRSADIYVVRIDGKQEDADSAEAERHTGDDDRGGWTTLAEPKAKIDLLTLRNGKTSTLGQKALATG